MPKPVKDSELLPAALEKKLGARKPKYAKGADAFFDVQASRVGIGGPERRETEDEQATKGDGGTQSVDAGSTPAGGTDVDERTPCAGQAGGRPAPIPSEAAGMLVEQARDGSDGQCPIPNSGAGRPASEPAPIPIDANGGSAREPVSGVTAVGEARELSGQRALVSPSSETKGDLVGTDDGTTLPLALAQLERTRVAAEGMLAQCKALTAKLREENGLVQSSPEFDDMPGARR